MATYFFRPTQSRNLKTRKISNNLNDWNILNTLRHTELLYLSKEQWSDGRYFPGQVANDDTIFHYWYSINVMGISSFSTPTLRQQQLPTHPYKGGSLSHMNASWQRPLSFSLISKSDRHVWWVLLRLKIMTIKNFRHHWIFVHWTTVKNWMYLKIDSPKNYWWSKISCFTVHVHAWPHTIVICLKDGLNQSVWGILRYADKGMAWMLHG